MIRINLLPIRQTRKLEAARREMLLAVAGGLAVVVLGGMLWSAAQLRLTSLRTQNNVLQAEIDRLADEVKRVDEMEAYKAELERKLTVIDELRAKKAGPVHMLDELAVAAPEKLQLMKMEEHNGQLRIEGISVTNDVISQFLRSLDASPYFEQVFLEDIQAMPPEKNLTITLKSFKLTARLVAPTKAAPAAGGDALAPVPAGDGAPVAPTGAGAALAVPADGAGGPPPAEAPIPVPAEATQPDPGAAPGAASGGGH